MRNLPSLVLLGSSLTIAACMGNNDTTSTADTNSSDVSDSVSESAEVAASFAAESASSGITADLVPAGRRAELVVALETIAANPSSCSSGTASITPAGLQTADCASIGSDGMYPGGETLTFNSCVIANGGTLNGTASVTVTRALSAGATCGSGASEDVQHEATMTNLSYTSPSSFVLTYPSFDAVVTSTHPIGAAPTLLTLSSLTGERTVHDPAGKLILDHVFSGQGTVALATGSRTINGSFTVDHELLKVTAAITLTNLERVETCCKPISGDDDITLSAGGTALVSGEFSYGPTCGEIELNGHLIDVAECL
jgi:hypothetical protein